MWPFKRKTIAQPIPLTVPREGAALYECGGVWGDKISFSPSGQIKRVVGWKQIIPEAGDVLICPMQSGKTEVFIFQKVERCGNPDDMFFADVYGVGYTGEVEFDLPPPPVNPFAQLMRFIHAGN